MLVLLVLTVGCGAVTSAQAGTQPTLAGLWRLHEVMGELPEQAARALDGRAGPGASLTIRIEQTEAAITVRRLGHPAPLLRVLSLNAATAEHQVPDGGLLKGRAQWRARTVVADGHVAVKQGFLKRNVPFQEMWHLDESGRTLTVTTTLSTPLGVKRRTQVFTRVTEDTPRAARPPSTITRQAAAKIFRRNVNSHSHGRRRDPRHAGRSRPLFRGLRGATCGALTI